MDLGGWRSTRSPCSARCCAQRQSRAPPHRPAAQRARAAAGRPAAPAGGAAWAGRGGGGRTPVQGRERLLARWKRHGAVEQLRHRPLVRGHMVDPVLARRRLDGQRRDELLEPRGVERPSRAVHKRRDAVLLRRCRAVAVSVPVAVSVAVRVPMDRLDRSADIVIVVHEDHRVHLRERERRVEWQRPDRAGQGFRTPRRHTERMCGR
jgi:hypothetical protein